MMNLSARAFVVALVLFFGALAPAAAQQGAAPAQPLLKAEELDQLLAPIALYADPLLSEVLIASTYPLEIVQAARWAKSNAKLKGDALTAALAKQSWDDSVKSLAQVPTVLEMMSDKLDWTQKLGDAVLAQQPDVMDSIQRLRLRAQDNGKLKSTKEQTVTVKSEAEKQYVVIEPASPTEIYVPYYEPAVVYGDWPYPDLSAVSIPAAVRLRRCRCARDRHRVRGRRRGPATPSGATATGGAATSTSRSIVRSMSATSTAAT